MRLIVFVSLLVCVSAGPLWDYVHKPDPTYSWFDTHYVIRNDTFGWTGYLLNMTSQTWLDSAEITRSVWTHQLVVIVPDNIVVNHSSAIYVTGGGNNHPSNPKALDEDILVTSVLAVESGTICATLFQIPNQPIVFTDDPLKKERGEDALVAFTWWEYMRHLDKPEWVVYNAMVKAVVRAMDTVQAYAPQKVPGANIKKFIIAGASKRGWTTWLTGAVDNRVEAIMPIVMDMLNFTANVKHMYRAYGGWTFAFKDYYEMNITQDIDTQPMKQLAAFIDPLSYAENLTMPKLVVDATGDEFFMPDDDWYWWTNNGPELPGETYRLMVSNAEHSMATGIPTVLEGASAYYKSILHNTPRPKVSWTMNHTSGVIDLYCHTKPSRVVMRFANTFDDVRRDFRLVKGNTKADPCKFIPIHIFGDACLNPVLWVGEDIAPISTEGGVYHYRGEQPFPPSGWRAFFLDMYFPGPLGSTFRLTTQISIIPNTFPYPSCTGKSCRGVLV